MAHRGRANADEALIAALAAGLTASEAAGRVGLGTRTVVRRLADPAFRARLDAARRQSIERAVHALGALSVAAVGTLGALLRESTPAAVRLGAARSILEYGLRLREQEELEARVRALEERLAAGPRRVA